MDGKTLKKMPTQKEIKDAIIKFNKQYPKLKKLYNKYKNHVNYK